MKLNHWGYIGEQEKPARRASPAPKKPKPQPPCNRGETNPMAKLTEAQVREIYLEIRADRMASRRLAARYGVTPATIRAIGYRITWRDVTEKLCGA